MLRNGHELLIRSGLEGVASQANQAVIRTVKGQGHSSFSQLVKNSIQVPKVKEDGVDREDRYE